MSGYMDITGEPNGDAAEGGRRRSATSSPALYGVIAIEAALIARERTGRGQHIDLALFDSMGAMLANQAMNYLASGVAPKRMGNAHPNLAPYQTLSDQRTASDRGGRQRRAIRAAVRVARP